MAKNFDYIIELSKEVPQFEHLHKYCDKAEIFQKSYPEESANNARKALEWLVKNMLTLKGVQISNYEPLNELLRKSQTVEFINFDYDFENAIRTVQKIGNSASHDGGENINKTKSFCCLRALYDVVAGFMFRFGALKSISPFDATLIPNNINGPIITSSDEPKVEYDILESISNNQENIIVPPMPKESLASEAITRKYLIDYMLEEAGWQVLETKGDVLGGKACIEVEVLGMPTNSGKGYADYVLFSRGGKPLAVIEAKSTTHYVEEGRKQAILYADCLEKKYGIRPVIYYSNGFKTMVIDGLGYPDRQIFSFHSIDDLERMIQKRGRLEIKDTTIKEEITNRPYQQTAIKSILEWLNQKHRRGLLVLATGTGKTRVSISLCEILMRNNWTKNVLFLADRTALVNQAHKNYEALLPEVSMSVLSEGKDPDMQARIMFSTYQTMINYINTDEKKFSVGRFDLIIIDEAHRSVFGRYGAIFNYFDSLLIGLTATPRDEIDRNTYQLLQLDNGSPNYSYNLEEAVEDGYLIPYETLLFRSKIMETGIKWDDLPKEQRDSLEKVWTYEKAIAGLSQDEDYHRDIEPKEIFNYLINNDTIDKVLEELMDKGLKVQSGEEIGKTIIFAMNHTHAEHIVKRFKVLYPEKGENYCQLIDNYVNYASALILDFGEMEKMPQIAVSVDMLDTGVDVPSILNLVFFKRVKSKIKFMQMIGRGTRLCKGVFGNKDKEKFYIFDWCNNFDYFSVHSKGAEPIVSKSLTEKLFAIRLDIALLLQSAEYQEKAESKKLHDEIKEILIEQVNSLSMARIDVREKLEIIEAYRDKDAWICLKETDVAKLKNIASLLARPKENEAAKKFDLLMLNLQLEKIDSTVNADRCKTSVMTIAKLLEEKATIPIIKQRIETIKEVQTIEFWNCATIFSLERVRKELRDLIQFLEERGPGNQKFVIDIEDIATREQNQPHVELKATYQERVLDYLANNTNNSTLKKIQNFEQLTSQDFVELQRILWEEIGSRQEYNEITNGKKYNMNVAAFIRVINGIDRKKALEKYAQFIKGTQLNSIQEQYLKNILDYISINGDIQLKDFGDFPLKNYNWREVFGNQFVKLKDFVTEVHQVISA